MAARNVLVVVRERQHQHRHRGVGVWTVLDGVRVRARLFLAENRQEEEDHLLCYIHRMET